MVAYGSHSLTVAEREWSVVEKELAYFMNHWWHQLWEQV